MSEFSHQDFSTLYQNKFLYALFIYNLSTHLSGPHFVDLQRKARGEYWCFAGGKERMLEIVQATVQQNALVQHIIETTIKDIYPCYYPAGVVDFFLAYHSAE